MRRVGATVVIAAAVLVLGGCGVGRKDFHVVQDGEALLPTTTSCAHLPEEQGGCAPTLEEQRALNLRYADRLDFAGDVEAANAVAEQVRQALAHLVDVRPAPPVDDVRAALQPFEPGVGVVDNAVRTAGTAFSVEVEDGCVFGSIWEGELRVAVGGYVHDGGCLATYAH